MFPFSLFSLSTPFRRLYQSFSVVMLAGNEREDVEIGGKIIMPPSALEQLSSANISYPMMFSLRNCKLNKLTHCGVLEFVADEGSVYLPSWMMENLMLLEGDPVQIEIAHLPVASFSRFQPLSKEFLDITNPKAVLEKCLRHFSCLTTGDLITLKYNGKDYQLLVMETQPGGAVSIVECDMNVDFAPPVGWVEPNCESEDVETQEDTISTEDKSFVAFCGEGSRLDGKKKQGAREDARAKTPSRARGVPDYDWKLGTLDFFRNVPQDSRPQELESANAIQRFPGNGEALYLK